ncbi:MAG: 2-oxo acid dehydrogenase subunit E2 [Nitrospiraceae bacterium]|nr:2-oxo acid dehydrogenase subunit E2 [Nitrospiraceae bacterium]
MKVELPFLAEGVEGGDVVQVLVKEGDQVTSGQALIEIETDKATVAVPSPSAGKVAKVLVKQGDHLKVGQALVDLEGDGQAAQKQSAPKQEAPKQQAPRTERAPAPEAQPSPEVEVVQSKADRQKAQSPAKPTQQKVADPDSKADAAAQDEDPPQAEQKDETASAGSGIAAPPSVRRLARELGVDLRQVKGSEAGGRITAEDVKTFVRERTRRSVPSGQDGQAKGANVYATMYGNERREPIPSLRRKIAATVTQAWTTIPHVHQFQDADITDLQGLHKRYAPKFKEKGATLTLTSLFLKAVTHALKLYPQFNATIDLASGEIIFKEYYNIGVAVETPAGLIVPVVHDVDRKDLVQISLELADLAERTRKREIKIEELRGATFTVSNMGGLGAGPFTPIILPPQVGILGVGKGRRMPVYRDGQFVPRLMLPLCVAYDHRLIDGADGARFTNEIVKVLEDFEGMFLGL